MAVEEHREPRWEYRGRTLYLVDAQGTETVPSVEVIYQLLVERRLMEDATISQAPHGLQASRYPLIPALTLDLDEHGAVILGMVGRSRGRGDELSVEDLKRGHVVLSKTWFPIDVAATVEVLQLLSDTKAELGALCSLSAFLRIRKAGAEGKPVEDVIRDRVISPFSFISANDDVPNVSAKLYPYQLAGWRWLRFIRSEGLGGLLADQMGLGKTLQVISAICDHEPNATGPCLIVAPGSILENWRREIARFAPLLHTLKHQGPHRTGRPADLQGFDVVITSYDNAIRDNSLLNMIEWDMVVLDEAQLIRNPDAQRTRAVKHLRRRVGLAVTGTPVENRLLDLWSIIDFVLPDQLNDRRSFEVRFRDDIDGARLLETEVSPFVLRRRVSEVAQDLPPRIDIPQVVELSDQEIAEYDQIRQRIKDEYGSAATLVSLTALRMYCAHPLLLSASHVGDPTQFSKFQRLNEILREIFSHGEKALVFTSFTAVADMICRHVGSTLQTFARVLDGRLSMDERQPLIDEFSSVSGAGALILNPRAGGVGLNITASNHVIHYNPEWNPALEDQASARAHRRGQELPVTVHRLLVADTVEEVISARLERKRVLADTAVVGVVGHEDDYADIISALSRSPLRQN